MEIGKLPPALLEELILNKLTTRRKEVLVRSATGQDSSILATDHRPVVLSTDPITGEVDRIGWFAVHVACNDVAANGAEPLGVLLTLLLPPGCDNQTIAEIMNDAGKAAAELNVDILGGHTELTDAVNRPVVSTTAVGVLRTDQLIVSSAVRAGLDIVLTKGAGIEGTAILAGSKLPELARIDQELMQQARDLFSQLSVVPESEIAVRLGAVAMHDVTEGGVLGALYEVVQAGKCGFMIDLSKIPILPATQEICSVLKIDALRLISSGSMLIFIEKAEDLVDELQRRGIKAACIGKTTVSQKYLLKHHHNVTEVDPPESDELWRVLSR